jgi:tetratricopeptide (TPR) repeat protein
VLKALASVDVRNAEAGDKRDLEMIMGAVGAAQGGAERLTERAVEQLRDRFVGEKARGWVGRLRSSATGSLDTAEAVLVGSKVASLLGHHLGHWEESKALWKEVVAGKERLQGADGEGMLSARVMLAMAMKETGEVIEARSMYEDVLHQEIQKFGQGSKQVLETQQNLASLLHNDLGEYEAALTLKEAVVKGETALHGVEAETTLRSRHSLANGYCALKRHGEARVEYEAVLEAQRKLLGRRNPLTLHTQDSLALLLYDELREREEAIVLMREVVEVRTTVLGAAHADTQDSVESLEEWEARKVKVDAMSTEERQRHEDKSCLALEKLDEDDEGCECDECGVEMPIGVMRLTCEFCECDLCEACVATR